jgi:Type II secretion system (T2SS), protein E, N-terminal domain
VLETPQALRVWKVELGNRSDLVFMLRDYLRRNDATAEVCGPAEIEVTTNLRRGDLLQHLQQWEHVTGIPAAVSGPPLLLSEARDAPARPRLGELLVARGLLSEEQLVYALNEARETGELLGVVLVNKQIIFEDELARTLSEQLSVPYISVMRVGVSPAALGLMPANEGRRVAAIPARVEGGEVLVAFADPTDEEALAVVHRYIDSVRIAVSELSDIRMAWRAAGPVAASG